MDRLGSLFVVHSGLESCGFFLDTRRNFVAREGGWSGAGAIEFAGCADRPSQKFYSSDRNG